MATAPSAAAFAALLRAEGLTVVEEGNWQTHNRNHKGPWGPVNGVMIHHTVTQGTAATVRIVRDGYSTLPGPLCHGMIAKNGWVHLVGYGRANHAGLGDPDVLAAVIADKAPPIDNEATVDGNRHFYGFECENMGDGKDPWPPEQLLAIEQVSTAICRYHDWSARSVIRHLDWQPGKVDPRGIDWAAMQARIGKRLGDGKPTATQPQPQLPPPPPPKKPVVDLSKLVAAARSNPAAAGTPVTYSGVKTVEAALVNEGLLAKKYSDGHYGTVTKDAMSAWQERCGYRGRKPGQPADGIPGKTTLAKLGAKHGFTVIN
ncbi:N-acetylmuramoyl-L-alanine amidase [Streptomyces sp. NPDC056352]|uniref:N-acetylmuramoyl-L-alanine amidase n=1 Tax=Streptomyces sp. NPDC056352 TaxID=3345791 RepID=UPI0035E03215